MGAEVHLWQIGHNDQLSELRRAHLDLESRLQEWLARDISILDPALLVIGREVETDFGGFIDILCIDADGNLVIVELKRDRTPREVTAQALDYASWVTDLSNDRVTAIANDHLGGDFESAFSHKFDSELPETVNGDHRVLVVGSAVDSSTERIMRYLSDEHGVNINFATFHYFQPRDGSELLARVFVLEPSEVERKTKGKRRPYPSYKELRELAVGNGVAEVYDHAVKAFGAILQKKRRRGAIAFQGSFDRGNRVIISFRPGDSNSEDGLCFQLYKERFAELAKLPSAQIESLMPEQREDWAYVGSEDPHYRGFEGFIARREEIDRLAGALQGVDRS
jgi:hypothetical protein